MIEPVVLGDCRLILGDCLEYMKQMPDKSVDAVIDNYLRDITACDKMIEKETNHERSTGSKQTQENGSRNNLDKTQTRNRMALQQSEVDTETNSPILRSCAVGYLQGNETPTNTGAGEGELWEEKLGFCK